jgi:Tfp pilus assembly PilM family ATPase
LENAVARYLALDWDQNQVHVVAGSVRGGRVTVERTAVWQEELTPPSGDPEVLGRSLREHLKTSHIAAAPVLVSLARDRVIVKELRYPSVPETEEANLVHFQAVKELTDAADDVVIDYAPLTDRGSPEQRALAVIARKDVINAYQALCQAAGLKVAAITPRPFGSAAAARRAMSVGGALTPAPDPPDAAVAIITVGDKWAEFCVLRGEVLVLARTLGSGPMLAGEIRRNLTVYDGQNPQRPVQAVYLSAGPHADLRQRLGELTEVPIYPFDPLAGAEIEVPGNPGGFAGAAGLLYARAERARLPLNFVDPRRCVAPPSPYRARILMGVAVALMICLALFFTGRHVLASIEHEAELAERESADLAKKATSKKEDAKRSKGLDEWGLPNFLDELYDMTCRIRDVNQLHITQLAAVPAPRSVKNPSPYAARLTIEGEFVNLTRGREALDDLVAQFRSESDREYYILEAPPQVRNNKFSFTIQIKRRAPSSYTRVLDVEP